MSDLINILSIIDDKTQLINFPKLDPNSFKPAVLALIQRLKDTVASVKASDKEPTWDTLVTPIEDASENPKTFPPSSIIAASKLNLVLVLGS